jgi:putative flavoprotein involved in K+ transport
VAEQVDTVVIGAGQAGLATSYFLTERGREHVVLERGLVGETWRSGRWDGFVLNTPHWATRLLPGLPTDDHDPDRFLPRDEIVGLLQGYATAIAAPVREGVAVTRTLPRPDGGFLLETTGGPLEAANVVVASGAFQRPTRSPIRDALPGRLFQLHTAEYRNPEQLPDGAVLVVGSGQSGCQIAEELVRSGRDVYLSVSRCPWIPRRRHGSDIVHWLIELGLTEDRVDKLPSPAARLACNPVVSGNDQGHDCNPRTLAGEEVGLLGRIEAVDGERLLLAGDLEQNLANGDEFAANLNARIDELAGVAAPADWPSPVPTPPEELDLRAAGIASVLWATGFRPDFGWIDLPVADDLGWPRQQRGVAEHLGLYFVGVHWLHKRKSALLLGVGEDGEHVVAELVSRRE